MSKVKKVLSGVSKAIGGVAKAATGLVGGVLGGQQLSINIPAAQIPAAPAPTRRTDTGANVMVGTDAALDDRVGGGTRKKKGRNDVLGGLGQSGIGI